MTVDEPWAALLECRRAELTARLAGLRADLRSLIEATRDANLDDEHDPEGATVAFERSQLSMLTDRAAADLTELDGALARLAAGRFGRCERCGEPIGVDRLTARPTSTRCVRCAAR